MQYTAEDIASAVIATNADFYSVPNMTCQGVYTDAEKAVESMTEFEAYDLTVEEFEGKRYATVWPVHSIADHSDEWADADAVAALLGM